MTLLHASRAKRTRFSAVVERARRLLGNSAAGPNGIRKLSRSFGIAVDAGGQAIGETQFLDALKENDILIGEEDLEAVMHVLDRTGERMIDAADFIGMLRRSISPLKLTWIIRAWYTFNHNQDGTVQLSDILSTFHAAGHPDVVAGSRSEQQVQEEMEAAFSTSTNPDGLLTRQEFEQYCSGLASAYPNDHGFVQLIRGVWPASTTGVLGDEPAKCSGDKVLCNMTFSATQALEKKCTINAVRQRHADLDETIRATHRPIVLASALAVRRLSIALRERDPQRSYFLPYSSFMEALRSQRLYIQNTELLDALDTCGDGSIDYLFYLLWLLPPIPPTRLMMLERLWNLFIKDSCGTTDVFELHRRFTAKDGVEKNEFLASWDVRQAVHRRVTLEELVEWYTPLSNAIELDNEFEIQLKRQWGIS
ncbi:hypothetical protein TRVL_00152 [Trypanosoma vivax]|nr:hypothetical protein TRVL_00152 [Trypanosoma vivax]